MTMFHFLHKKIFLKISSKEYHIFRGNYAYQPDWKEKNDLPSSYKKFYIAVLIGFPFSFPESILCSLDVSWRKIQPI